MSQSVLQFNKTATVSGLAALASLSLALVGCGSLPKSGAEAQPQRRGQREEGSATVNVAIARTALLQQDQSYTGTTQPYRQVSLRSQVEGQLVDLTVDVGDRVTQGQTLARLDDKVLATSVIEAEAEVAARESEVAQTRTEVSNARTQVEDARLKLQQAQSDLARYEQLSREGAIPEQQVTNARTTVGTALQALRSAQEQVRTQQQAVSAAERRVIAQRAIAAREEERQSYSVLTSPVNGFVLERVTEPGNLAQPGNEILKLGDFSQVKVSVQVSERELGTIRVRQPVQVRLDAFPNQRLNGRVSRVSPAADPTARLIPVEVTLPNPDSKIGSGLLARVSFTQQALQRVVVPEAALRTNQSKRSPGGGTGQPRQQLGSSEGNQEGRQSQTTNRDTGTEGDRRQPQSKAGTVFVISGSGKQTNVEARQVALGDRRDEHVEILSGLKAGERFVTRSSKALRDGDPVRLSILSEG
ncbi:MAG: efflux RND transporter periplasmic adaptor subunit [Leptolyngbyaceae cyanobacterium RU_5_1]|nr:efflux RND transporter periplasmic adaptor subunit [Leptolyngbyaceae cyanobacterium RU_5_1]